MTSNSWKWKLYLTCFLPLHSRRQSGTPLPSWHRWQRSRREKISIFIYMAIKIHIRDAYVNSDNKHRERIIELSVKRHWERGGGGGMEENWNVPGGRGGSLYPVLHCQQGMTALKWTVLSAIFNASRTWERGGGETSKILLINHSLWKEKWAEAGLNHIPSSYQSNALLWGPRGPP